MRRHWLAGLLFVAGCASMPAGRIDRAALAEADLHILQGCYACLQDARATYERLAVGRGRAGVVGRLFETYLLLGVREQELALDASGSFAAARALAGELPAALDADRYLAIAEAIPPDRDGQSRREREAFVEAHAAARDRAEADLTWLETPGLQAPVRQYLAAALECAYVRRPGVDLTRPVDTDTVADTSPLVRYRRATCPGRLDRAELVRLRAGNARFAEAALQLARFDLAVAAEKGPGLGLERLGDAADRFPTSPLVAYLVGLLHQLVSDCEQGLESFDRALELSPEHEAAWLGRTMCLSLLNRSEEAIESATRLIALDPRDVADAYYWRAWNHYGRRELDRARADIERAKARGRSIDISTLAGMIAHDQDDLDPAERDLTQARRGAGSANCTAMWYLGLVYGKRRAWPAAAPQFDDAVACYAAEREQNEEAIRALRAEPALDEGYRSRRIDLHQAIVQKDIAQRYASALNAANCYARIGDRAAAIRFIAIAAEDPGLAPDIAQLREYLGHPPAE